MFNSQYSGQSIPSFPAQLDWKADAKYSQFSEQAHIVGRMAVFVTPIECLGLELLGPNPVDQVNQVLIIF